jgi:hypothetical protein
MFARGFVEFRDTNAFGDRLRISFANSGIIKNDDKVIDILKYVDGFIKHDGVNFVNYRQVFFAQLRWASFVM